MSDWMQQSLTPPAAVELRIRLGIVPEREHAQVMVEILEPSSAILLGQWSRHHFHDSQWNDALDEAVQKAKEMLGDTVEPF